VTDEKQGATTVVETVESLIAKGEGVLQEIRFALVALKGARDAVRAGTEITAGEALEVMRKIALTRVAQRKSVEWVEDGNRHQAYWVGDRENGRWRVMSHYHNTHESHPGEDVIVRGIKAATMVADCEREP
jgi:hypothetical protein